ncbi:hypothetical protein P5V15_012952 [Pogonomyrmex californicus]
MRRFIIFAFVGMFVIRNVTSRTHRYPLNLTRLLRSKKLNDNKEETRTVCDSEKCKETANLLLENMNKSVDPCNDFYEFACGRWPEHNPIPEEQDAWSATDVIDSKVQQQIQEILEAAPAKDDLKLVKLAKKWYKACMDTDAMEKRGIEPLVSTLSRLGGWPMLTDNWNKQEYSWQEVDDHYMRLTGRNSLHDVRIKEHSSDPIVVEIDTPHLLPGSKKLQAVLEGYAGEDEDEEENEGKSVSDEDPSDEEKQSDETQDEPGSEGEDDSEYDDDDDDNYDNDDYYDCDDDDDDGSSDDDDDNDDGSGECDDDDDDDEGDDEDIKERINKKKITSKIVHKKRKNKKLQHVGRTSSSIQVTKKHSIRKMEKQKTRKATVTGVNNKYTQHINRRKKVHILKNQRNHLKKIFRKTKKILDNMDTTTFQININEIKKKNLIQQYINYILKVANVIAKKMNINISQQRLLNDINDMVEFQLNLIQIIPKHYSLDGITTTLNNFQEWYDRKNPKTNGKIDWINKIITLFDEVNKIVDDDLSIEVNAPNYFISLVSLLDETSTRTIINYIHWNFISKMVKATTNEMRELYDSWEKALSKEELFYPRNRSEICKGSREIKEVLAYEFVRKYFTNDVLEIAIKMFNEIEEEMEYLIQNSDWLNDKGKNFASAKLKNMKKMIGYPNWYKNISIIQDYYQELSFGCSYYENILRYNKFSKWKSLRMVVNVDADDSWLLDPLDVNAYYLPWTNALIVSAANFENPWFACGQPQALNYGMVGAIMGHEVNHGFDDQGYMYDKDGTFLGWFSAMADAYDKKKDCFVEQFNNYPIDTKTNKKIKDYGEQTTGDNIADTMGLQAIFKAYQSNQKKNNTTDAILPGLEDFTSNQLFFLGFANSWCEAIKSDKLMTIAENDEHSIARLRVIGSVSNSDDFAEAYNCLVGSPMNPEKKCNIWK